ncbi:MAG: DUF169 domain-containing protein [Eubacteriaceae bacterium]
MNKSTALKELTSKLKMKTSFIGITRLRQGDGVKNKEISCILEAFSQVAAGNSCVITKTSVPCMGALSGMGFFDEVPKTPGGFGHFLSYGAGEGFPPGEHVKCCPQVAEFMINTQPKNVMTGYSAIQLSPYKENDAPDIVTGMVNPDQLSTLIHLFNFRKVAYDNVYMPMSSGCASIFRLPFGELTREEPRGVVGNIDVFSRPHFDKDLFFFTVSAKDFNQMLEDVSDCVISAPIWKKVETRLESTPPLQHSNGIQNDD